MTDTKGKADTVSKEAIVKKHLAAYYRSRYKDSKINLDDILPMSRVLPLLDEYAQAYAQTESKWIAVEDGLPEYGQKVLVFGESKGMNPQMGGAYIVLSERQDLRKTQLEKQANRYQDENNFKFMSYVTHWQPLPPNPKEVKP